MPMIDNYKMSLLYQERAKKRIPGLSQLLSKRPDQFSLGVWPGYFKKARGAEVWDLDDNRYIDMSISGIGANVLGYADPDVDAAVKQAIDQGSSSSLNCPEEVDLADLLCELHPWADMVRYTRTGGEAMAVAVRIARAYTGRDNVAFCGYHGWHDWYLAANLGTEDALGEHLLSGLDPNGVPRCLQGTAFPFRYNNLDELKKIVETQRKSLAAVVMEPIRGDSPTAEFLEGVRTIVDDIGAVLILDEVSAGFRLNTGGAHLTLGLRPDVAVFSKALGNGYPIAAIIGTGAVMEAAQTTFISSTNWTERTGPAAAIATIQKHRDVDAGARLIALGKMVQEGWRSFADKNGLDIDIGGIFPMGHFAFKNVDHLAAKAFFVQEMLHRGFLASTLYYAMYAHEDDHVGKYLSAVDEVFKEISGAITNGDLTKRLRGAPAVSGFKRLT
ncbi:MAG: aminotransferase class III-fold pyridoxal phosphate-dependent enzyme [Deltaproteobacteria bacterium]|nr:aminotransferase class III-fold pyridoxal phosphate-dependent enzyme [Candidatus Zymogenaceae bacterium]